MNTSFNTENLGCRKTRGGDFCWYVLMEVWQIPTTISISIRLERCMVAIQKVLTFREAIKKLWIEYYECLNETFD